jgi:hypothetical protein
MVEEIPVEKLIEIEQQYLDWCKLVPEWFYNMAFDAKCPGRDPSPESREKNRLAHLGKVFSPETCEKLRLTQLGRKHSDERKESNRQFRLGKCLLPETKAKVSESLKNKTTYSFLNKNTGETFVGIPFDFRTKHNIGSNQMSYLLHGQRSSAKGWVICR